MAVAQDEIFSNKIFLCGALPLLKTIASDVPSINKMFKKVHCVYQISALCPDAPDGKYATHFQVNGDEWVVHADKVDTRPFIELEFKSVEQMNSFFKGKIAPNTLPKMKGIAKYPKEFIAFMACLLKMANVVGATEAPEKEEDKALMVKCMFYLLTSGISKLNKEGHPEIKDWTMKSPDRVYALAVNDHPEVSAFIRIKAGKSRAGRGEYKRAMPFFTLRFDSFDSALGTLLGTSDMLEDTKAGRIIMDGGPEFGAVFGGFLLTIGSYAK